MARSALLSNQFPLLYDAASGGHHLTPRLVGFIRLVVILCVLRYLGCRPVVKLHSANIAAHFTSPRGGVLFMGGVCVGHCAAISGFWAASRARFVQYRSTHLPVGWDLPSNLGCLTSTVLRYLVFRPPPGPVSANIAAQYSWSRISGSSGARLPACPTRLGERHKATGGTCASAVTANCARNSHYIMIGCNEN